MGGEQGRQGRRGRPEPSGGAGQGAEAGPRTRAAVPGAAGPVPRRLSMHFDYVPYEGQWLPIVQVVFAHGRHPLPPMDALVDTGATISLAPLEVASMLGIEVDDGPLAAHVAGGGTSTIYASPEPLECRLTDPQ